MTPNICGAGECRNEIGGYFCICPDGYLINGNGRGCPTSNGDRSGLTRSRGGRCGKSCGRERSCQPNRRGDYSCRCPAGLRWDRKNGFCVNRKNYRHPNEKRLINRFSLLSNSCRDCFYGCNNQNQCNLCDFKNGYYRHGNFCLREYSPKSSIVQKRAGRKVLYSRKIRALDDTFEKTDSQILDNQLPIKVYYDPHNVVDDNYRLLHFIPSEKLVQSTYSFSGNDSADAANLLNQSDNFYNFVVMNPRPYSSKNLVEVVSFVHKSDASANLNSARRLRNDRQDRQLYNGYNHAVLQLKIENEGQELPKEMEFSLFVYDEKKLMDPMILDFILVLEEN